MSTSRTMTALSMPTRHARQQGVVMIVALLLLAAMTLAGIALMRSVSTTNVVAGNLAFRQSATRAADQGIEAGAAWLGGQALTLLNADGTAAGYLASRQDPAPNQSWAAFFDATLDGPAIDLPADAAGNTVSYVVQRLCNLPGAPGGAVECTHGPRSKATCAQGSSCSGGGDSTLGAITSPIPLPIYYRITARSIGPRNTRSYVQAIVSF